MPVIWLVAGVLLAIAELFTLDFVLIMLAGGAFAAAAAGLVRRLGPDPGRSCSPCVSALGLLAVRPAIKKRLHRGAEPAVMGVDAIEGSEATVIEQVAEGRGHGQDRWRAVVGPARTTPPRSSRPGTQVRVVEVKGATALVWKE